MNALLQRLESGTFSTVTSKCVFGLAPCSYCDDYRHFRKYSTLKASKSRVFLQRNIQTCHKYETVRREHYASLLHIVVNGAQNYFEFVHATTGLDWWASLMVAVVPIRIAMTCTISTLQSNNMKKVVLSHLEAMPELQQMNKSAMTPEKLYDLVKKYRAKSQTEQAEIVKKMQAEVQKQYAKRKCHPYKNFGYGISTIPFWVAGAFAIRNMTGADVLPSFASYNVVSSMDSEGCLWFKNFLLPDDTHALPIIEWLVAQLNFEMIIAQIGDEKIGWVKHYIYFIRFWQLWMTLIIWVLWNKPSGLLYYWVLTTSSNMGTNLLLRHPVVRQKLRLQFISKTPYRDMFNNMKARYDIRRWFKKKKPSVDKS